MLNECSDTQVTCAPIPKNDRLCATGLGAAKALRDRTTVSDILRSTRPSREHTSVLGVIRLFQEQTPSTDTVSVLFFSTTFALQVEVDNCIDPLESRYHPKKITVKSDVGASCRGAVAEAQLHQSSSRHGSLQPNMPDGSSVPSPVEMPTIDLEPSMRPVSFVS